MNFLNFIKKNIWLVAILFLFLITRIYKINSVPGSVYWDEASIGYNAYSITQDFRDEWGEFLPLHFRAFGEFKLPVYIYSVAVLVKFLGLNEISLRLPAVLYSLGSVLMIYFLVNKTAKDKKLALFSSFLFAITPWTFIFSRTGYEVSAGLFFFLVFVYFLITMKEKKYNIFVAGISAILSFYSYNSFRVIIPIFILVWILRGILYKRKELGIDKWAVGTLILFALSIIPVVRLYTKDSGSLRAQTVGIKSPAKFVSNYFSHFSYDFLFGGGDINDRSQVPGWGEIYFVGLPFFALGIYSLIRKDRKKFDDWFLFAFLLIAPIPSAITREAPHALRSILLAPTFSIISSLGIFRLVNRFKLKKYRSLFLASVVLVYLLFFQRYFFDFINNYSLKTGESWQVYYKKMFTENVQKEKGETIVVSDRYAQPYIFALYYLKYPPAEFRKSVVYNPVDKWGFSTVSAFGNFEFKDINPK